MQIIYKSINKNKEYIMGALIVLSFISYYFDFFNDEMMVSGFISLLIVAYISILWSEQIFDERDEFIRSKVDRYLYIFTIVLLLVDIIIKTFLHQSYMSELIILTLLAMGKIFLSKMIKDSN
jgi:hypothetical protein